MTYIAQGITLLILSDRLLNVKQSTIPILLAASSLHQHLLRTGNRTKVSIIVESGEAREVHQFAALIGFGVDAINPYLAYATIAEAIEEGHIDSSYAVAVEKYSKGIADGVVKVMSKMGFQLYKVIVELKFLKRLGL